ncbi:MAG: ADP-ribosylglycohydrolase family protein, partial [Thermoprotei archaeon]
HLTYTAERAAYRNLVIGLKPPETATFLNPYREWIGAQIRADLWGYVSPGDPERAAEYAYRDPRLSHTKNGIYGEIFVAALIALAYVHEEPLKLVEEAARAVPERSRLAEAIRHVVALYRKGLEWEEAVEEILARYGRYHPVHTVNNAAIVVAALLWGEGDFARTITYAVLAGLDTDCNGATAGSVVGLMLGASRLPREWVRPLNDTLATGLSGLGEVRISKLAERTVGCIMASA